MKLVEGSRLVEKYLIQDFKQGRNFYYLRLKITLIDESELYIREYVSEAEYIYSYHWQGKDGNLRIRWDNAPHHKDIKTFPHHKHTPELEESNEIGFEEVLKAIEERIKL
ncbi:MAG TPA: DUF6516 family protein [bacterium]|nr:DUF6516 family protein [bacterium]